MRFLYLFLVGLLVATPATADVGGVEGLEAAVKSHEAALLAGDHAGISATVMYPHVQFYPDGRVVVNASESDLPAPEDRVGGWRVTGATLVHHEGNQAIVRAAFEGTGPNAGRDIGAGLWCFTRVDGKWLVNWRHYLGPNLGADATGGAGGQ